MAIKTVKLSAKKKREVANIIGQATHALAIEHIPACEQLCKKAEALQPGNADALNLRGICAARSSKVNEAISLFRQAIDNDSSRSEFHINLGGLLLAKEKFEEALPSYQRSLKLEPHSLPALKGCANILNVLRHYEECVDVLEKHRHRHPKDVDILFELHKAYYNLVQPEQARNCLYRILELDPQHAAAHCQLALLAQEEGRMEAAEVEIRAALVIDPVNVQAFALLVLGKKFLDENDSDIVAMKTLYDDLDADTEERSILSYCLGRAMEQLKKYDAAFDYFRECGDFRHRHSSYDEKLELTHLGEIMRAYSAGVFQCNSGIEDATPIFILGMPRCGSTLTEQIIASHPKVASKGEWSYFEENLMDFDSDEDPLTLERITSLSTDEWRKIGQAFLGRMKTGHEDALRITDKSLSNIRMIGAIHCALPHARIIHVRRHPLDTCLSIFKSNVRGALFEFGCNLEQLGRYYKSYLSLMQHWRTVLPKGVMYEIDYEQLVANQEDETRKLIDFCNLEWNDNCLEFHKTKNIVKTASIAQVRQPIYSDAMAAWKHYGRQLQPLIDILGPEYSTEYTPGCIEKAS